MFEPGLQPEADAAGIAVLTDRNFLSQSVANFTDKAVFGELTWHISDDWQITGGARAFKQTFDNTQVNAVFFFDQITVSDQSSKESDVLFKFNTSYQINDEVMFYATRSEGFRRGGANALPSSVTIFGQEPTPTNPDLLTYAPDEVTNLEMGFKGRVGDYRYSVAAFTIDWDNIQLNAQVTPFALAAVVNAGSAESNGLEAEFNAIYDNGFEVTFGYSFVDAKLTNPSEIGVLEAGIDPVAVKNRRLPGVPKHTASVDLSYGQDIGNWYVVYGLNGNYHSDSLSQIDPITSTDTSGYAMWNTSVLVENDRWGVRLFVNNLFNEEGVINTPHIFPNVAGPDSNPDLRRNELLSRPRVIGVNVSYVF
jgi:outer membrane receptor protein involved in Fe transport